MDVSRMYADDSGEDWEQLLAGLPDVGQVRDATLTISGYSVQMDERIAQAEELIRAKNRLEQAMYDSDFEHALPKEAAELERAYEQRYGVDLSGDQHQ